MNILVASVVVSLLAGCHSPFIADSNREFHARPSGSDYPASWPALADVPDGACPNVKGIWGNDGGHSFSKEQDTNENRQFRQLSFALTRIPTAPSSVVRTDLRGDQFTVEFTRPGFGDVKMQFRQGEHFVCKDGMLWFTPKVEKVRDGLGSIKDTLVVGLRRTAGDQLVGAKRSSDDAALFWVIPMGGASTVWYRWSAAQ